MAQPANHLIGHGINQAQPIITIVVAACILCCCQPSVNHSFDSIHESNGGALGTVTEGFCTIGPGVIDGLMNALSNAAANPTLSCCLF
jgi:hypothetical protein